MKLPLPASIKGMVTLIVLLALLPALGLLTLTSWLKFRSDVEAVEQEALRSARAIAVRQAQFIEDTRLLLLALSRTDEVLNLDGEACLALFRSIAQGTELYSRFRLLSDEGRVIVSSDGDTRAPEADDLASFTAAQHAGLFTIYGVTRQDAQALPVLECQIPVSRNGRVVGALAVSAAVRVQPSEIHGLIVRHVEHLHITDKQGRLLFSYPAETPDLCANPEFMEGVRQSIEASPALSGLIRGRDGHYTLYEKIGSRDREAPSLTVMLALSTTALYDQMFQRLGDMLAVLAGVLCTAILVTLYLCNITLLRPVRNLLKTANRIREGRLDTRIGDEAMPGGLRQLALSLDSLSYSLAERDKELTRASEVANTANQAKTDFLANMSHEIRTPMNAILGMTYLARQENLTDQQRGYIDNIHAEAEKLLTIINDILDFSKLEAGKLEIEILAFDLARLLEEVAETAGAEASRKGLDFSLYREPGLPAFIQADPVHLSQVLNNILLNAVRATHTGGLRLRCLADRSGDTLVLEFGIDSGNSLQDMESELRLVDAERRSAATLDSGAGLSLAIARQLTRLMRGSLELRAGDGEGSSIVFRLPCEEADAADNAAAPRPAGGLAAAPEADSEPSITQADPLRNMRILLVEDNPVNQQIAEEILRSAGAAVDVAGNGFEALGRLEEEGQAQPYKVVLMDLQMPELDGFAAARRIRMDERRKNLPIIAMTAHSADEEWARCREAGMNDFVSKPLDVPDLLKTIMKWVKT